MLAGAIFLVLAGAGMLGALANALLGRGRYQRAADLAAISAARSVGEDFSRPDVALAFDCMLGAAREDGISLIITSAYRSDAEQARLYAGHPDPRWVAPPGKSLHRLGTELDLGPPGAYRWLANNAGRFHFVKALPMGGLALVVAISPICGHL